MHDFGRSTPVLKAKAPNPAVEALRLLGRWRQLDAGHLLAAAGCSCGAGTTSVRVQDFEQDILAFLRQRHARAAAASGIAQLLSGIARRGAGADLALLADLERSIDSFEQLHRAGRTS
jgi:hypothetical protein